MSRAVGASSGESICGDFCTHVVVDEVNMGREREKLQNDRQIVLDYINIRSFEESRIVPSRLPSMPPNNNITSFHQYLARVMCRRGIPGRLGYQE